jgi:hypothetical protein
VASGGSAPSTQIFPLYDTQEVYLFFWRQFSEEFGSILTTSDAYQEIRKNQPPKNPKCVDFGSIVV